MYKRISVFFSFAAMILSCSVIPGQEAIYEIGFPAAEILLAYNDCGADAEILSDGEYTVTIPQECGWLSFADGTRTFAGSGDGALHFVCTANRNIPRSVTVEAVRATNKASLTIVQDGLLEGGLAVLDGCINVNPDGGGCRARVSTKINPSEISFETVYQEEEASQWIGDVRMQNNFVVFTAAPNFSSSVRHARIVIKAAGQEYPFLVCQYPAGTSMEEITVDDVKALASGGTTRIEGHRFLSAVVLNGMTENNGAENRMISVDIPDYEYQRRIVYVQNEAGDSGLRIEFSEDASSMLPVFSKISIDLGGLVLTRKTDPERYMIENVPLSAIVKAEASTEIMPREKSIGELTYRDLYTFVSLRDVEIPVRKGPYTPFDIRKLSAVTAYPVVLRDIAGSSIYMMVNVNCTWARDGRIMPRGRGSVRGVLVNESCDCFEWDTELQKKKQAEGYIADYITGTGNIGPWQIRPCLNSDIRISEDFEDAFSDILYEWAYADTSGVNLIQNCAPDLKRIYPTHSSTSGGAAIRPFGTDAVLYCRGAAENDTTQLSLYNDWTHLGPYVFGGQITGRTNGNGVTDDLGRQAHWNPYASVSTTGVIFKDNGSCWAAKSWSMEQYWCCEFSAASLSQENAPVSVQFGVMNDLDNYGAPRYWAVEYSLDGGRWTRLMDYTVPDFVIPATKKVWQLPGPKYQSVNLPDEVIGREKVYVRLIPASSKAGNSTSYDSAAISQARSSSMNYFAIRYNK